MARKRESKEKTVYHHLQKRFLERFNLAITKQDMNNMIQQIQSGKSNCLICQSRNRSVHVVNLFNKEFAVVYNKDKKIIHTVFPDSWKTTDYNNPDFLRYDHLVTYSGEVQEI